MELNKREILGVLSSKGTRKEIPSDPEERKVEILSLLQTLSQVEDRSGSQGRAIRRNLRLMGFRLSNPAHVAQVKEWTESLA